MESDKIFHSIVKFVPSRWYPENYDKIRRGMFGFTPLQILPCFKTLLGAVWILSILLEVDAVPTPSPTSDPNSSSGSSTSLGALVLICCIGPLCYYFWKKSQRDEETRSMATARPAEQVTTYTPPLVTGVVVTTTTEKSYSNANEATPNVNEATPVYYKNVNNC